MVGKCSTFSIFLNQFNGSDDRVETAYVYKDSVTPAEVQASKLDVKLWTSFQSVQLTAQGVVLNPLLQRRLVVVPPAVLLGRGAAAGLLAAIFAVLLLVTVRFFVFIPLDVIKLDEVFHLRAVVTIISSSHFCSWDKTGEDQEVTSVRIYNIKQSGH